MNHPDIDAACRVLADLTADYYFALRPDPDGAMVVEWLSPGFYRLAGRGAQEASPQDLWHGSVRPQDRQAVEAAWNRALEGKDAIYHRRFIQRGDRGPRVREVVRAAFADDGQPILYGAGFDLSGERRARGVADGQGDRYRNLFDHLPIGMYRTTPTGQIIDANAALVRLFGFPDRETLMGCNVAELYADPRDRAWELSELERREVMLGVALRVRRYDGRVIWVEDNARAVRGENGQVLYFEGTIEDITARRNAEQDLLEARHELERRIDEHTVDLRASEQRFRAMTSAVPVPMLISRESDGLMLYANPLLGEMFGIAIDELIGRKTEDFYYNPADRAILREHLEQEGSLAGYELRVRKKDGTPFWIAVSMRKTVYEGEPSLITGFYDITDRKRAEAALTQAKEEAEAANRAKSRFLANMSHEIRTPITAMLGAAELMSPVVPPIEQQRRVDMILRNGRHLLTLVDDLLDLARVEAGQLGVQRTRARLPDILRDVRAVTEPLHGCKDVDYRIRYETQVPDWIETDPVRLKQAVINLVNNALRLTDAGHVWVRVRVDCDQPDPRLTIAVEDTGIGIAEDKLDAIFDAFAQIEPASPQRPGGVGLGLTLARWIAGRLGGTLEVESQLGRGSTFTLRVATGPLEEVEWVTPHEWSIPSVGAAVGGQGSLRLTGRILLAEDSPDTRELIRHVLTRAGADVMAVSNGADAVKAGLEHDFDLALIDIRMPGMDGIAATADLRRHGRLMPIIALTASNAAEQRDELVRVGFDDLWPKPISLEQVIERCQPYLEAPAALDDDAPIRPPDAMRRVEEDPRFQAVVAEFVRMLPERFETLRAALDRGDRMAAREALHQLVGVGGTLGFMPLSEEAARLLEKVKKGTLGEPADELERLVAIIRRTTTDATG